MVKLNALREWWSSSPHALCGRIETQSPEEDAAQSVLDRESNGEL